MMCLPYFLYGLSSPSGGPRCCCDSCAKKGLPCCRRLRRLCRHRHHRRRCCLCCAAAAAAAAAAVLLLSCCCAAAVVTYVFLKKYDAVLRDANRSFLFSIRDLYFCNLMEFRRFAHRKHCSQSDAGMNLALFKLEGIIG